jgi:hypothetical protein
MFCLFSDFHFDLSFDHSLFHPNWNTKPHAQTMFMTPEFRQALYAFEFNEARDGAADECIALQLQRLFASLQLSKRDAVDTKVCDGFG